MPLILFAAERTAGDKHAWNDEVGAIHHFPNQYRSKIKPGERFIYYRGVRRAGGKRGRAEYFGTGVIGKVWPDAEKNLPENPKAKWAWYCGIEDYQPFEAPVPRLLNGKPFEDIADNLWGVGVRSISDDTFDRILKVTGIGSSAEEEAAPSLSGDSIKPRIFASSVFGVDLSKWGAWGFTDKGTRDRLASIITDNDYVLSIGTRKAPTPLELQGRLLALMKIGAEPIQTEQLVDPDWWAQVQAEHGHKNRWPYGFPILSAERFLEQPSRADILPRLDADNLHMALARHYVELTPDEVAKVLAQPRISEPHIYSTASTPFQSKLMKPPKGPPPSSGQRVLLPNSGPAVTYWFELVGDAVPAVAVHVLKEASDRIYKIGFSNDPKRRLAEMNTFLPCPETLCWKLVREQWHTDEINAYAMEQKLFQLLQASGATWLKGELFVGSQAQVEQAWEAARAKAQRPIEPVLVPG